VDHTYINAVQLMTGSAGWPLNVITLPDGRPVWGGTYFRKDEWLVEELITDKPESPPTDIKFYTFYGEVLLVSESNPAHYKKFSYWDAEMQKVETGRFAESYPGLGFTEEELALAKEVSLQIPTPLIRLDFLRGEKELVFCEATYYPGNFHSFNAEWDRKLGVAYRQAEARLIKDLLAGKEFTAFSELSIDV